MVSRSFDSVNLHNEMIKYHAFPLTEVTEWLDCLDNVCLTDGSNSFALFEYCSEKVYTGHYFFVKRGKQAVEFAKECLDKIFQEYDCLLVKGLTPVDNLGALWMNKELHFTDYGTVETIHGTCRLVVLTKERWLSHG